MKPDLPPPAAGSRSRPFFVLGALSAMVAVVAGAFGAHALRDRLPADLLAIFETGARYQMYHALGMLAAAWAMERFSTRAAKAAGALFFLGTIVFSGSLYALALTGAGWWGAITPIGGIALIAGWGALAWSALKR